MKNRDNWVPLTATRYANRLSRLREKRRVVTKAFRKTRLSRSQLTPKQRENILHKTGAHCHICGGKIKGKWQADHVYAYSRGGQHTEDNYLPAHNTCNNYRWHYTPEEFQEIMRLGIWLKTQIIRRTHLGMAAAEQFVSYEKNRIKRRKTEDQ
jgi:hypothetical protein